MKDQQIHAKKAGKRAIKADETRRALFAAAAQEVGKRGYEAASIAAITKRAGVANGTFYNYFVTRQQLFDQLLPAIDHELLDQIRQRGQEGCGGIERERGRLLAYLEFFETNPGFLRIVNEAEVFAPEAYKQHMKNLVNGYSGALKRQLRAGELVNFQEDEAEVLVYMLLGTRSYLTMMLRSVPAVARKKLASSIVDTYIKLVGDGLFAGAAEAMPVRMNA